MSDGGDNFVGIGGPGEGFGHLIGVLDEAVDGGLEIDDGSEDAALQSSPGQLGEEALDGVQPRAGGRHEVEGEALMPAEPLAHLGMFVGGVVVEDDMDQLAGRDLGLDGVEEADELLMAAAHDKRIKACIANHPFADLPRFFAGMSIKSREETDALTPTNYRMWQLIAWRNNCSSIRELLGVAKDFVFDPKDNSCPFLGVSSAGEYANPATKALIDDVMAGVSSTKKKLIVASFDEGAGTHCMGENTGLMSAFVFDWLDEIFVWIVGRD